MINSNTFYGLLEKYKVIHPVWKQILNIIDSQIKEKENKEAYLILFAIYFTLIDEGNIAMSLNIETLKKKWNKKLETTKVLLIENKTYNEEEFESVVLASTYCIENYLLEINEENLSEIIGYNKIFEIEDNYLYVKKYNQARKGIINSLDRLFSPSNGENATYVQYCKTLSKGQEKAVIEGLKKNLIITGGPGTGKTTSILFLLINLLSNANKYYDIYLIAPGGKASGRMKESLLNNKKFLDKAYEKQCEKHFEILDELQESTIHSLLSIDHSTNGFYYNKNHQFNKDSIFVIDEASMIDVCLFNCLLEAIPTGAKVYIMGDKNQLPSVDCGAVFGELLIKESLKENIVELDESRRFGQDTIIYELAQKINNGEDLPISETDWKDYETFEVIPYDSNNKDHAKKPVFYYLNHKEGVKQEQIIASVANKWGKSFYKNLQSMATNLDSDNIHELNAIFDESERARILCCENLGARGVKEINKFIYKSFIDTKKETSLTNYYPGMLMMISKNNKQLNLYNGDGGILVTFKNDKTIYFMVKKKSSLATNDGKVDDDVFKIGPYMFYPLRLIGKDEIDKAYAITVHKSQGSDYENILVILPDKKGHPLLNRQIIYTAITRTKGNTYILSNQDRLVESKDFVIVRDTNIA